MTARIWPIRPLFGCGVIFGGPFLYLSAPTGPTLVDFYLPRKLGFPLGWETRSGAPPGGSPTLWCINTSLLGWGIGMAENCQIVRLNFPVNNSHYWSGELPQHIADFCQFFAL